MSKKQKNKGIAKDYFWWNCTIGILVIIYIVLTSAIFVVQKKIEVLSAQTQNNPQKNSISLASLSIAEISSQFQQKEELLQAKLANHPQDKQSQEQMAEFYYQQGNAIAAIEQYQKILQINPNDTETHLALGQLYMADRQYAKEAIKHLKKVLELVPGHSRRQILEMWIQPLEEQKKEEETIIAQNGQNIKNRLEDLKKRLEREPNPSSQKKIRVMMKRLEKSFTTE